MGKGWKCIETAYAAQPRPKSGRPNIWQGIRIIIDIRSASLQSPFWIAYSIANEREDVKRSGKKQEHKKRVESLSSIMYTRYADDLTFSTNNKHMTCPLIELKQESEIEDLFDQLTLANKINGKSFSRESNFDTNRYYGKEIFSKYISHNFRNIDFSGFKPILGKITEIMNAYKQ
jgi:hypothetical protein